MGILFVWACREVLAWYPFLPHGCGLVSGGFFPSFWEGLSLRRKGAAGDDWSLYIFPSFWEGLSLRLVHEGRGRVVSVGFPFLLGGTFIEAHERGNMHI